MEAPLNQISADQAASYVTHLSANIERQLTPPRRPRPRALFTLFYKRAVFGRVCQRAADLTRADLEQAARWGLSLFETCGEPRQKRPRDVWEMRLVSGLLAAYGDADQHVRLDGLPSSRWYHPPSPELEPSALAYQLFARFLVTGTLAQDDVMALDERIMDSGLHPVHGQAIGPIATCLQALVHDDPHDFEQAWATLTTAFATIAQFGEFSARMEGLLDPMALGLLALGQRKGFSLAITSPYAPLELLSAPPAANSPPEPVGAA